MCVHGERLQTRVSPNFLRLVDAWRCKQPEVPLRAAAIDRVVLHGMNVSELVAGQPRLAAKKGRPS